MASVEVCQAALDQFGSSLLNLPDVGGVGIGPAKDAGGTDSAIIVYLISGTGEDKIPTYLDFVSASQTLHIPVRVQRQGVVRLE